jgi:hypothetical protein
MQPGYSIQLVWPLASFEAVNTAYEHIEPEHFFNALLKFIELNESDIAKLVRDRTYLEAIRDEQKVVREQFGGWGLSIPEQTTALRRSLRQNMGVGNFAHQRSNALHRSEVSRTICKRAEEIAADEGAPSWQSIHLLGALLEQPQGNLAAAIQTAGIGEVRSKKTPFLDQLGVKLDAQTNCAIEGNILPAVNVVMDAVIHKKSIALINKGGPRPNSVIRAVITQLKTEGKSKRFVKIILSELKAASDQKPGFLSNLLAEVSQTNIILCLECLASELDDNMEFNTVSLERALSNHELCCISILDEDKYIELKKTQTWLGLLQPVWLEPRPELPW